MDNTSGNLRPYHPWVVEIAAWNRSSAVALPNDLASVHIAPPRTRHLTLSEAVATTPACAEKRICERDGRLLLLLIRQTILCSDDKTTAYYDSAGQND